MLFVDTSNFNHTIASHKWQRLLIAYYDPRSKSFKDLQPALDAVADELARYNADDVLGAIGACDVTVDTFLGTQQAPEMLSQWQENKVGAFKFGSPRYFPLIIKLYQGNDHVKEYTGVVSVGHIIAFLKRHKVARGGEALKEHAALQTFLSLPGPLAVGCGLESGSPEFLAFNETAHGMHGSIIFGFAGLPLCMEEFSAASTSPQVLWARGGGSGQAGRSGGALRSLSDQAMLANATRISSWLLSHRTNVLQELTPDTSHVHLDREEHLVIYLVDPQNASAREYGEELFEEIVEERVVNTLQLTWADCLAFGSQFSEGKSAVDCPTVVIVNTKNLESRKASIRELEKPPVANDLAKPWSLSNSTASGRLLAFLENVSAGWQPEKDEDSVGEDDNRAHDLGGGPSSADRASANTSDAAHPEEKEEELILPLDVDFVEAIPPISSVHTAPSQDVFDHYHALLADLLQLRATYTIRYGNGLDFDFSDLDRAQKLHPQMRSLGKSPESVKAAVEDKKKLSRLWRAIEERDHFRRALEADGKTSLHGTLVQGLALLRGVFRRLFKHLHAHAAAGTLGVSEAKTRPVERRHASELSVREFIERYASPGQPVIIIGINITEEDPWTLEFFRERCNVTVDLKKRNASLPAWGQLETAGLLPLAEFIDSFRSNATRRKWYLHDWPLPPNCPAVFGPAPYRGFTMPKYFAGDYFQRAAFEGYQHTWPSLFIGSNETQSGMHIDSGGTNFWLYLLSGRKEWRFFSRRDLVNVYKHPAGNYFHADVFEPDLHRFPLLKSAEMYTGIQDAGELMFIPGGNPHGVRNLEPIHGISMNYVDLSNVWIYLWHQLAEGNWKSFEMFTDGSTIKHGLQSEQESLRFGTWKSTPWAELSYDIH